MPDDGIRIAGFLADDRDRAMAQRIDDLNAVQSMTDYVKAWQCIGCGMIEAPQTCIGVCEYRRTELVYAFEHEQALARAQAALRRADALEALVRQLASTTPRKGEWERSYRALQEQARRVLSGLATDAPDRGTPAAAKELPQTAQGRRES